jgi:phage FluMu protein Com
MKHERRCTSCGRLLGIQEGARLTIRYGRAHQYLVSFPVTGLCPRCGTMNELAGPTDLRTGVIDTRTQIAD